MIRLRRPSTVLLAICLTLAGWLAPASPVAAATWGSALFWVDGMQNYAGVGSLDTNVATFNAFTPAPGDPPYTEVTAARPGEIELFGIMGADDTQITAGSYVGAKWPKTAGAPVIRTAVSCPTVATGSFVVHEVEFNASRAVTKLAAEMTWQCGSDPRIHYRAVRYGSAWPIAAVGLATNLLDFGTTPVGDHADQTVTVTNTGNADLTVTSAAIDGADAGQFTIVSNACDGVPVAEASTCDIVVRAVPSGPGASHANLTLNSDGFAPVVSLPLQQLATQATQISLALSADVVAAWSAENVTATVTPTPVQGSVSLYVDGLFSGGSGNVDPSTGSATISMPGVALGTHAITARFFGQPGWLNSVSDPQTLTAKYATSVTVTSSPNPAPLNQGVTITAAFAPASSPSGGTMTIVDQTTATTLGSGAVTSAVPSLSVSASFATIGTHVIKATFASIDPNYLDSTGFLNQFVALDTWIDATGLATSLPSIFPYRDGYRDVLAVRGSRNENISVAITVTSVATHRVVARGSIVAGMGAYSWNWTGKTSSGSILPAGSYVIKQVLRDASANTLTWSKTVSLSTKRLYTYTYAKTLNGNQLQYYGKAYPGSVAKRSTPYANEVRLNATPPGWAAVEYYFTLPSAAVSKSLRFYITGKASGGAYIGLWNPSRGSYLNVDAYDSGRFIGTRYATYGTSAVPASHISAHHVHGMVLVGSWVGRGTVDVAKVKVVFVYGVLK